jgi:pimeloyl-ACP methyl ester carboxylesterase
MLAGLALGYRLAEPVSGFLFRYLRWSLAHRASATHGQVCSEGSTIHFVSYGTGPAVLLLHGGLSNRLAWFSQIPALVAAGRQVVVLDVRGHGKSKLGTKNLDYHLLADDAISVMDRLRIQRADVVGWSDGGNTALVMAKNWPQRIGRIVAISANFNPEGLTPEELAETHLESSGTDYWLKRWWTGTGEHLQELERRVKSMWRTYPRLQPADLQNIDTPILVLVGQHDVVRIAHAKKMADSLKNGTLKIVPGGHSTPVTHPIEVNAAIGAFLDGSSTKLNFQTLEKSTSSQTP